MTCDHSRRILHSTKGHPSRWNDKTLAFFFDDFMCSVHEGKILQDLTFVLYSWEGAVGTSWLEATNTVELGDLLTMATTNGRVHKPQLSTH